MMMAASRSSIRMNDKFRPSSHRQSNMQSLAAKTAFWEATTRLFRPTPRALRYRWRARRVGDVGLRASGGAFLRQTRAIFHNSQVFIEGGSNPSNFWDLVKFSNPSNFWDLVKFSRKLAGFLSCYRTRIQAIVWDLDKFAANFVWFFKLL